MLAANLQRVPADVRQARRVRDAHDVARQQPEHRGRRPRRSARTAAACPGRCRGTRHPRGRARRSAPPGPGAAAAPSPGALAPTPGTTMSVGIGDVLPGEATMRTSAPSSAQRVADAHEVAGAVVDDGDARRRAHELPADVGSAPFVEATPTRRGIERHRRAQRRASALKAASAMWWSLRPAAVEVERRARRLGERAEGMLDELGRERAHALAAERQVDDRVRPARQVERAARQRLVHGHARRRRSGRCRHGRRARRRSRHPGSAPRPRPCGARRSRGRRAPRSRCRSASGARARSGGGRRSRRPVAMSALPRPVEVDARRGCASRAVSRTCSARRVVAHAASLPTMLAATSTSRSSCRRVRDREAQVSAQRVAPARTCASRCRRAAGARWRPRPRRGPRCGQSRKFVTLG